VTCCLPALLQRRTQIHVLKKHDAYLCQLDQWPGRCSLIVADRYLSNRAIHELLCLFPVYLSRSHLIVVPAKQASNVMNGTTHHAATKVRFFWIMHIWYRSCSTMAKPLHLKALLLPCDRTESKARKFFWPFLQAAEHSGQRVFVRLNVSPQMLCILAEALKCCASL